MNIDWIETPVLVGDKILVSPIMAEKKTSAGIIIPDTVNAAPQTGTIVAISDEVDTVDKKGDKVYEIGTKVQFHPGTGYPIKLQTKSGEGNFLLFEEPEILFTLI